MEEEGIEFVACTYAVYGMDDYSLRPKRSVMSSERLVYVVTSSMLPARWASFID